MIVIPISGSIVADLQFDEVVRTFDANSPPRPLTEVYKKGGNVVATITKTYTSSGASLVPTTEVRS